jgi:hypothetical protein
MCAQAALVARGDRLACNWLFSTCTPSIVMVVDDLAELGLVRCVGANERVDRPSGCRFIQLLDPSCFSPKSHERRSLSNTRLATDCLFPAVFFRSALGCLPRASRRLVSASAAMWQTKRLWLMFQFGDANVWRRADLGSAVRARRDLKGSSCSF